MCEWGTSETTPPLDSGVYPHRGEGGSGRGRLASGKLHDGKLADSVLADSKGAN